MANSDTDTTFPRHINLGFGAGPWNLNRGPGQQSNHTISGGSQNSQYNAKVQHFHGATAPDPSQVDARRLRRAIFLTDPTIDRARLIQAKGQRVAGTCEWIKKDNAYDCWLNDDIQPLLCIRGSPGKGNTMLSIFLSQELEARAASIYFFYAAGVENRDTAVGVLRGLIWHSMVQSPDSARCSRVVLEVLQREHKTLDTDSPEHIEAVLSSREIQWIIFVRLLTEESRLGRIFCALDGLDACDEDSRDWLATKLLSLKNNVGGEKRLKLIVTSRELTRLRSAKQVILDLDHNEGVSSDVKTFVRTKCLELAKRISQLKPSRRHRAHLPKNHRRNLPVPLAKRLPMAWLSNGRAHERRNHHRGAVNHAPSTSRITCSLRADVREHKISPERD